MQHSDSDMIKTVSKSKRVISFKCELQENIQKAMKKLLRNILIQDQWIIQAAIAGFLMQKDSKIEI